MRSAISALLFALTLVVVGGTAHAAPSCVDNMLTGMNPPQAGCFGNNYRDIKLVIHRKNNSWVSYTEGAIAKDSSGNAVTGNMSQLFSDRVTSGQKFNKNAPDTHNLWIRASDGQITINNVTWGFTTVLTNTSCSNNLITASNGSEMYLISWGGLNTVLC